MMVDREGNTRVTAVVRSVHVSLLQALAHTPPAERSQVELLGLAAFGDELEWQEYLARVLDQDPGRKSTGLPGFGASLEVR